MQYSTAVHRDEAPHGVPSPSALLAPRPQVKTCSTYSWRHSLKSGSLRETWEVHSDRKGNKRRFLIVKVSIITVCYNASKTVADTIRSVRFQTYKNIEHVIVDGASSDGTAEIIFQMKGDAKFVSEPDEGIYDAMNKGIRLSTGDIIGFLNADDVYFDQAIVSDIAKSFSDSTVDACHGDLVYVDQNDMNRVVRYWKSRDYEKGLFKKGWMPAHPTFFVRRKIYEQFGCFDLDFKLQSDFELTMRLLEIHRIKTTYIPKVLVKMRMGGATNRSFANVIRGNLEAYRACKKNGVKVTPLFMIGKILSRIPQFFNKPSSFTS